MLCSRCGEEMHHFIGADGKRLTEFLRCPKCWLETKRMRFHFEPESTIENNFKKDVKKVAGKRRKSTGVCRKHR